MSKTNEQLIKDYKKSNVSRREKIVAKAGFSTEAEYLASLVKGPKKEAKKTIKTSKMKGVFYVVDVLDASGSMIGGKYENSKRGIVEAIKDLTARNDVKYSLVEFIDSFKPLNKPITNASPKDINTSSISFSGARGNDTPLYHTVYNVINGLQVNKEDKVLINVYTDGGDNGQYSNTQTTKRAADLIAKVQKENFTVTFVATEGDLRSIKRDINIDDSNTLATANTAEGFEASMVKTRSAKMSYFASADAGQDVLVGFYKKGGTL